MKNNSFTNDKRLCGNNHFLSVLTTGKCVRDKVLTVYSAPNRSGFSRLGVSVSKSSGDAVRRNRLKRLVREVFRLNQDKIPAGFDYIVLIRRKFDNPSFELIKNSFINLVLKK